MHAGLKPAWRRLSLCRWCPRSERREISSPDSAAQPAARACAGDRTCSKALSRVRGRARTCELPRIRRKLACGPTILGYQLWMEIRPASCPTRDPGEALCRTGLFLVGCDEFPSDAKRIGNFELSVVA